MEEYNKSYGANNHTSLLSHAQSQSPHNFCPKARTTENCSCHFFSYFGLIRRGSLPNPLFKVLLKNDGNHGYQVCINKYK